jgi:tetracycline resistance efflux pump
MVLPIVTMVITVPIVLWITGDGDLMAGSGSKAVLWGVIVGLLIGATLYKAQGIFTVAESTELVIKGIQGLVPLVIVLSLAFTIGATTRALGTGVFVAQAAQATLPTAVVPAIVFLLACFIAFSTGTSWGTFGIMIPIVIPMIELLGLHPGLTVAAALGGGIFGDHCSPISDTTIVASMASATDHIDHVRTQMPYAVVAAIGAVALFLVAGAVL